MAAATRRAPAKKAAPRKRKPPALCPCGCGERALRPPKGATYRADLADKAVAFFARQLRHMKGRWRGQAFVLEPWQEWHIVRPLFGTVERGTGLRWYREALIGLPRKNGKSEVAAGIALYGLLADGEFAPEVYSLAGDKKQARLVFNTASQMAKVSPLLHAACDFYKNVVEVPENGGIYHALSADADLQHGLNPHMAVIDEYHIHKDSEQYEAIVSGTGAREQPLVVTITTAAAEEAGPLWDLLTLARSGEDDRLYLFWVGADADDDPADPAVWARVNPASWITEEYLARQYRKLPLAVFERLHLNRFPQKGAGSWLPVGAWDACDEEPLIDPDRPCVIGVDSAPKRDLTAVVLDQRDDDGWHNVKCWTFEADEGLGYLDFDLVEGLLRELAREFYVTRIVVDPYAMIRSMMTLAAEGLPVEDFPQSHARMVPASIGLHELVIDGRIAHGGDPALAEAAANATIRETSYGWRLEKAKATKRIDPLVALAMAARIAEQEGQNSAGPTVMVV